MEEKNRVCISIKTKEDEKKWKEFLSYHFPNHYASSILKEDLIDNGFWSKRIGVSPEGYGWISARFSHYGKFIEVDNFEEFKKTSCYQTIIDNGVILDKGSPILIKIDL